MGLKLNAVTGGGSIALNPPNSTTSNADVVLTLPANDGDASQFLQTNGSGALTWAGAGKVLQTQTAGQAGSSSITSTSFTDTGLTVNITPSSTSNKILAIATLTHGQYDQDGGNVGDSTDNVKLVRDSTDLQFARLMFVNANSGIQFYSGLTFCVLDSPASTSQLTYKVQAKNASDDNYILFRGMKIVVMEVAPN